VGGSNVNFQAIFQYQILFMIAFIAKGGQRGFGNSFYLERREEETEKLFQDPRSK